MATIPTSSSMVPGVGGDLRRRKVCATTSTPAAWGAPLPLLGPFTPIFLKAELSEPMQKTIVTIVLCNDFQIIILTKGNQDQDL